MTQLTDRDGTPIVNPHHLTKGALKLAQGKPVLHISDEDFDSWYEWRVRTDLVNKIVAGVIEWHQQLKTDL